MNFLAMNVKEIRRKNLRSLIDNLIANGKFQKQEEFAEQVEIDKSYLSQMLMDPSQKGSRNVSEAKARQVESKLSLEIGYLDRFDESTPLKNTQISNGILIPSNDVGNNSEEYVIVPVFDLKAACGSGYTNQDELLKSGLVFKQSFLRKHGVSLDFGKSSIIYSDGDSMLPSINHNDVVLIDHNVQTLDNVSSGKIYVFVANKELRIKRLFKNVNGSLRIVSDNSDKTTYPDEVIPANELDMIHICGRVVWRAGDLS